MYNFQKLDLKLVGKTFKRQYNINMEKEINSEIIFLIEKVGFPIVFCLVFVFRLDVKMQKLIELNYRIINNMRDKEK
jgi:hypothetical protein